MEEVSRTKEHAWLASLAGEWLAEGEGQGPDGEIVAYSGIERVRTLDGVWTIFEGNTVDGTHPTVMTLGYDPVKGKFVGSFVGSMMTHMWTYEGELDGNTLTLDTVGPSFSPEGGMAKYQDVMELTSDNERVLRSVMLGSDGQWTEFMKAKYRRR